MADKKPLAVEEGVKLKKKASAVTYNEKTEGLVYNENNDKLKTHIGGADREVATLDDTQTLTNKTIDADLSTISNIGDDELKAGIDAAKLADGSVSNTEFQYLDGVTSAIQTQIDAKTDDTTVDAHIADTVDAHDASAISYDNSTSSLTATEVQSAIDEVEGRVDTAETDITNIETKTDFITVTQAVDLDTMESDIATNTSGLSTHIADTTTHGTTGDIVGTSDAQVLTNKTIDADLSTISNIGDDEIKAGVSAAKIHDGSVDNTEYGYLNGVTSGIQGQLDGKASGTDLSNHTSASSGVHGATGSVVGTTDAQTLTNKTFDDEITLQELGATPSTPASGYKAIYPKTDGKLYTLDDAGVETEVGAGGGGGLDTFYTEDFETTAIGDIDDGNNATFLGGGTLAGTKAYETSSPIAGTRSLKYTQASGSLNDYVALPAITLDDKEKGNSIGFNHYFTYDGDAGDIEVIVWDVANSKQLVANVSGEQTKYYKNKGNPTRFTVQVYPPTTATTLRVGFQVKVENIGAILVVDDFEGSSNPNVTRDLVNISDWESFTPTGSFTNTTYTGSYRRYGDTAEIQIRGFLTDIPAGGTLTVNLPSGLLIDTNKLPVGSNEVLGTVLMLDSGTSYAGGVVRYVNTTTVAATVKNATGAQYADASTPSTPFTWAANDVFSLNFSVPIQNWTSETTSIVHSSTGTENTFSAVVPSSGTTLTSEGASAIASLSWGGNTATLTLNSGQFSVAPAVHIFPEPTSYTVSATTITATYGSPTAFNVDIESQGADYKNPNAYAVTPTSRTCYIKDVKSSGTAGGTFTAGAWQTRDLNTLSGDTSFVTLSSNQFTLTPGKYEIEATVPGYKCGTHKAALYSITDSSYIVYSSSEVTGSGDSVTTKSGLIHSFEVSGLDTFEIRHRCFTTSATSGYGLATSFGVDEIYTQVVIRKIL